MKRCTWCNEPLPHDSREDKHFCDDRCRSAYFKDMGVYRERFHVDLPRINGRWCDWCGEFYSFNDYAKRGGQRRPRFCRDAHRVAFHRSGYDEATRRAAAAAHRQQNQQQSQRQQSRQQNNRQRSSAASGSQEFWTGYSSRFEAAMDILGVSEPLTSAALKKAWRQAVAKVHPDVNKAADATYQTQRVNWAYEYLKVSVS